MIALNSFLIDKKPKLAFHRRPSLSTSINPKARESHLSEVSEKRHQIKIKSQIYKFAQRKRKSHFAQVVRRQRSGDKMLLTQNKLFVCNRFTRT